MGRGVAEPRRGRLQEAFWELLRESRQGLWVQFWGTSSQGWGRPRAPASRMRSGWQALSKEGRAKLDKTCRFFNTSAGCRRGGECDFLRVCWTCGSKNHAWVNKHYRG